MADNLFSNPWALALLNSSLAPNLQGGSPLAPPRPFRGGPEPFQFNATASLSPLLQALPPGTLQGMTPRGRGRGECHETPSFPSNSAYFQRRVHQKDKDTRVFLCSPTKATRTSPVTLHVTLLREQKNFSSIRTQGTSAWARGWDPRGVGRGAEARAGVLSAHFSPLRNRSSRSVLALRTTRASSMSCPCSASAACRCLCISMYCR